MEETCRRNKMKFTYTKITGHYFCQSSDEWEEDGIEFTYEPSDVSIQSMTRQLVVRDYGYAAWEAIKGLDLIEETAERYKDELKDIFEKEAMQFYDD